MRKLLATLGLVAALGASSLMGCRLRDINKYNSAQHKVVMKYADKNNDGLIEKREERELMADIAKKNGMKYRWNHFYWADSGEIVSYPVMIKIFNEYKPSNK